jgi:hypothetical protein
LFFVLRKEVSNSSPFLEKGRSPSAKNSYDSTNFVISSDYWVYLACLSEGSEVNSIFGQRVKALLGRFAIDASITACLLNGSLESVFVKRTFLQYGSYARILQESKKNVVLSNKGVMHVLLERLRFSKHLECRAGESHVVGGWILRRKTNYEFLDRSLYRALYNTP